MATQNKFQDFAEQLEKGVHNFASHVFKVALTNAAPNATDTILANITQIANGNGYTTGGTATTVTTAEASGTMTVQGTAVVFTATGSMGPFRYAVLYNDTATSPADALISWADYGSSVTMASTETFTVTFGGASPGTIHTLT
jgi:flagellar capping protein FliD